MPNPFCSTFISDGVLRSALSAKISLPLSRFSDCQISQQGAEQAGMDNAILKKSEWRPFFFFLRVFACSLTIAEITIVMS